MQQECRHREQQGRRGLQMLLCGSAILWLAVAQDVGAFGGETTGPATKRTRPTLHSADRLDGGHPEHEADRTRPEKPHLSPTQQKFGARLRRVIWPDLREKTQEASPWVVEPSWLRQSRVHVYVTVASLRADNVETLRQRGLEVERTNDEARIVEGWLNIQDASRVGELSFVTRIRPVVPGRRRARGVTRTRDAPATARSGPVP